MGLDFTNRKDSHGAATYMLSDGSYQSEKDLQQKATELTAQLGTNAQIVVLDGVRSEGQQVCDFYDITTLPAVLIVLDDDQIYQSWVGQNLPTTEDIAYALSQSGLHMRGDQTGRDSTQLSEI
ncbi:MAG TPA: hypothetical protein VGE34_03210 [Candidatus Saccharimonadales bacterium]